MPSEILTPSYTLSGPDEADVQRAIDVCLVNPRTTPGAETFSRHVQVTRCLRGGGPISRWCSCFHCTLSVCERCGGYEGGLTTHCPGDWVGVDIGLAVYHHRLDFTTPRGWHVPAQADPRPSAMFASARGSAPAKAD